MSAFEEIGLSQFENLVRQKIQSFANLYAEEYGECEETFQESYPAVLELSEWAPLFAEYLMSQDKLQTFRAWASARKSAARCGEES